MAQDTARLRALMDTLRSAVVAGAGALDHALRERLLEAGARTARGEPLETGALPADLAKLADDVAHRPTEAAVPLPNRPEDATFEAVLAVAVGAGTERGRLGLAAIEAALGRPK